jgi:hypothetical protein
MRKNEELELVTLARGKRVLIQDQFDFAATLAIAQVAESIVLVEADDTAVNLARESNGKIRLQLICLLLPTPNGSTLSIKHSRQSLSAFSLKILRFLLQVPQPYYLLTI